MQLLGVRVAGVGPFENLTFRFGDVGDRPRSMTVVLGGAGVGKTSLLAAIASTRPGHAVVQSRAGQTTSGFVVADWALGDDDPSRPHPLRVVTPNAPPAEVGEDEVASTARRREQALFDRRAAEAGGFVLVAFSGARWFSRAPVLVASPDRTLGRYDVRSPASFDDATRADLARETKQVLTYAGISAALGAENGRALDGALRGALDAALVHAGYKYMGVDARSLEPTFAPGRVTFDDLPASARHLVAMLALPTRALFAAYPQAADPRQCEGVVLVDDIERQLAPAVQRAIAPALRLALPRVQWIVTTGSPIVASACDATEVLALRRMEASDGVQLFDGELARLH